MCIPLEIASKGACHTSPLPVTHTHTKLWTPVTARKSAKRTCRWANDPIADTIRRYAAKHDKPVRAPLQGRPTIKLHDTSYRASRSALND
eukprot:5822207-Prymnesium_polylepis.1